MIWPLTVPLRVPLRVIDTDVAALRFREPLGRDLIGLPSMETDPTGWALSLADRIAENVPAGTVLGLPMGESLRVMQEILPHLSPTAPAG
ncbi:MAG: phage tail assembly protein [Rhodospirillales bacterium]|nr:phage tail assembly protein [Rhodospirillales bacterium]